MTIDERLRLNIHRKFSEILGPEEADALIAHIMPVPWQDVATKDDMRVLSSELRGEISSVRGEIAELRGELHREISGVGGEIGGVRGEIAELRGELHREIGGVHGEIGGLRAELHQTIVGQTRWLMGYVTALSVAMLAVARLLF